MFSFNNLTPNQFVETARQQFVDNNKSSASNRATLASVKNYVNTQENNFSSDGVLKKLQEALNVSVNSYDNDNDDNFSNISDDDIDEFADEVSTFLFSIDTDETDWEISAPMSDNLRRLFENTSSNPIVKIKSDWVPPSTSGLNNSAPIVKFSNTKTSPSRSEEKSEVVSNYNFADAKSASVSSVGDKSYPLSAAADEKFSSSPSRLMAKDSVSLTNAYSGVAAAAAGTAQAKSGYSESNISSAKVVDNGFGAKGSFDDVYQADAKQNIDTRDSMNEKVSSKEEEEDEDEEDDDDDDGYYDDEDEDDEGGGIGRLNMSANLMAALGMDVSEVDTVTDWTPPSFTGLDNSKRLV